MDEMIGRVDRLQQRKLAHPRGLQPDLSRLLYRGRWREAKHCTRRQSHAVADQIDWRLVHRARAALEDGTPVCLPLAVRNHDRAVGALLSWAVAQRRGSLGLEPDTIVVHCSGSAGQSFGAFLIAGVSLDLVGDANDYVGKGLSGGRIVVRTPPDAGYAARDNIVIGNVALYGATSGEAYFNGMAGERFAVRNSDALAVVEGIGDHGCEYMTGGAVLVLGATGRNFGAGMSGGEAFVLDADGRLEERVNGEMVRLCALDEQHDLPLVLRLLENHVRLTRSSLGRQILEAWPLWRARFVKVLPHAYAEVLEREMAQGRDLHIAPPPPVTEALAA
jgi:glutamate synthase (NADPH/NADH) large chain